jgi:dolichol-phosphate mannosyltransferase
MREESGSITELQIVLPVYNEQSAIKGVLDEWKPHLDACTERYTIVAIDDGSRDETSSVIAALQAGWGPKLELVRQSNIGHGATIHKGYVMAIERRVPWVFQIDSDGQCDPKYFKELWQSRDAYDIVSGYRAHRDDGYGRVFVSLVLRCFIRLFFGDNCRDANVPYRLMRTTVIAPLMAKIPSSCGFTNVALSILAVRARLRRKEIPITFRVRTAGESTVSYGNLARKAVELYKDLTHLLKT